MKSKRQMSKVIDATPVIEALYERLGAKTQTELAKRFGRKIGAVQGWELRGYFTAEQIVGQLVLPALQTAEKKAAATQRNISWPDAIENVLREEKRPLHYKEIARCVHVNFGLLERKGTVHRTCQKDKRFIKIPNSPGTFDLEGRWKRPSGTIQSMITVKAGTLISRVGKQLIAERKHCKECECRDRSKLQLHHNVEKAKVFRKIVDRNRLSFGPNDPIRNILRGLDLLMNDPQFCDTKHMTLLCDKHHNEKRAGK